MSLPRTRTVLALPLALILGIALLTSVTALPAGVADAQSVAPWQVVAPELNSPLAIAADANGNYYAIEHGIQSVIEVSGSGRLTLLGAGISSPSALYVTPAGDVYVSDSVTGAIDEITPAGTMTTATTALDPSAGPITDIAVASSGEIWFVQQQSTTTLYQSTNGGTPTASTIPPGSLGADASGNVYNSTGGTVFKIAPNGTYTNLSPPPSLGVYGWGSIHVDANGDLFEFTGYPPEDPGLTYASGDMKVVYPFPQNAVWNVSPSGDVIEAGTSWIRAISSSLETSSVPMDDLQGNLGLTTSPDGRVVVDEGQCGVEVDAGGYEHPHAGPGDAMQVGCAGTFQPDGWVRGASGGATPASPYLQHFFVLDTHASSDQLAEFATGPDGTGLTGFGPQQSWGAIASNGTDDAWAWTTIGGGTIDEIAYPGGGVTTVASPVPNVQGLAVDGSGDVFATTGTSLIEIPNGGTPTTVSSALVDGEGMAFDASGNLYVADTGAGQVDEDSGGVLTPVAGSVPGVTAVGFDAEGDLYAYGTLGVEELVRAGEPTPATGVVITSGNAKLTVSWHAPSTFGTGSLTSYTVTADAGGSVGASCTTTALSCVLMNSNTTGSYSDHGDFLQNDQPFEVQVLTNTSDGGVSVSAPSTGRPVEPAGPPQSIEPTPGSHAAQLHWFINTNGDAPSSYAITTYLVGTNGALTKVKTATVSASKVPTSPSDPLQAGPLNVTGLTSGKKYVFSMTASNAGGTSAPSFLSGWVIPLTTTPKGAAPSPPRNFKVSYASSTHTYKATWNPPATKGSSSVKYYCVQPQSEIGQDANAVCVSAASRSAVLNQFVGGKYKGWLPGQYTVAVYAVNATKVGPPSATMFFAIQTGQ